MSHVSRLTRQAALPLVTACSVLPGGNVTAQGLDKEETAAIMSYVQGKPVCAAVHSFKPTAEQGVATSVCGYGTGIAMSDLMENFVNAAGAAQDSKMPEKVDLWFEAEPKQWQHMRIDTQRITEYSAKLALHNITPDNVFIIPGDKQAFNLVAEDGEPDKVLMTMPIVAGPPIDRVVAAIVQTQQKARKLRQQPEKGMTI